MKFLFIVILLFYAVTAQAGGYNRHDWPHWIDADHDCQNTRTEILIKYSTIPVTFKTTKHCKVLAGSWIAEYSGIIINNPHKLDIDHLVPLKEAYLSGGDTWTREQRKRFANDIDNLIPVTAHENRSKGDKDPARWLPDNPKYLCTYVQRWMQVKGKYHLILDDIERDSISEILDKCKK